VNSIGIGDTVDIVLFDVESGKIREFAVSTAVTDPIHTERDVARDAGFASLPATLTHSVVTGHQRDQHAFVSALGLDISRVVVGSVSWRYLRTLVAGDSLTATRTVIADESKRGMRFVTLETAFADAEGALVLTQTDVLIERAA
jgi:acyl dehydratase